MAAKTNAERQREYRERHNPQPVDNPNSRYETLRNSLLIVTEIVTEIRNEIAEIRAALIVITPPPGPSAPTEEEEGSLRNALPGSLRNAHSRNGDSRRDYDVIARCSHCDNNGFIAIDDGTGASTVRVCNHA